MNSMKIYLKLEDEFQELNKKMIKLKDFINSNNYIALSDESQSLLFIQYAAMRTYGSCLVSRMKLIMKEDINGINK